MPSPTPDQTAAARAFVNGNLSPDTAGLIQALVSAYGDAYVAGVLVAAQQTGLTATLASVAMPTTPDDWAAFWSAWKPGNIAASDLLDNGGLADLLTRAQVTVKGITGSLLDTLGNRLADGVAQGLGSDEIASTLMDVVNDPGRADMIARTETARAVTQASVSSYVDAGVTQVEWLDSPGACDECLEYAGKTYPVDDAPDLPVHPNCRCDLSPIDPGSAPVTVE
ncbi:MAG TPA: minor capsid protein [Cellulomonadaceae bacterium]|nr:minor capsid protein [Cellulomonadaceae bacterium]